MKKMIILIAALMGCSSIYAIEQTPRDVNMGDASSGVFDMSGLQATIEEVAYNKTPLTYQAFLENVFERYTAFQNDIVQMQQANPTADFTAAITEINKLLTISISDENYLKFAYVITIRKFHCVDEITPEIFTNLMSYLKANAKTLIPGLPVDEMFNDQRFLNRPEVIQMFKNLIYTTINAQQEQIESFYKILLSKPHLNEEYKAIINGQKYDLSEEFLQELITSALNLVRKVINASIEEAEKATGKTLAAKDMAEIEKGMEKGLAVATQKISSTRTVLPLVLKHFGDLGGFGLI